MCIEIEYEKKSLDALQNNKCDYKMNDIITNQVQNKDVNKNTCCSP